MKIFLDTADLQAIKKWHATGVIDGITTNPSHLSKAGGDSAALVKEICTVVADGDVSIEVTEKEPDVVYAQAKKIAQLGNNVVVKIPCDKKYYGIINRLVQENIKLNITLVFTLVQGLMMAKLGVQYISPFVGRLDDIDVEGITLIHEMRHMMDQYNFDTEILAASLRHVRHIHHAIMAGADVATIPIAVFEKMLDHPLTDRGIAKFDADWQKLGIKQFP